MEKDMFFYDITENRLLGNSTPRSISSDSENFGLMIDLDPEYHKTDQEIDLKNENRAINYADDELSIGCEENETSVNFFIKAEKRVEHKPVKKSVGSVKASKKFKFERDLFGKQKQNSLVEAIVKKSKKTIKIEFPPNKCPKGDFEANTHQHMISYNIHNCTYCPFNTRQKWQLRKHKQFHSTEMDATFRCSICAFGSNTLAYYNKHLQLHSMDGKERKIIFQCPLCPFAKSYLSTASHFKSHAKKHQDLKNIVECPLCGMKTKRSTFGKHAKHHIMLKTDHKTKLKIKYGAQSLSPQEMEKDMGNGDKVGDETTERNIDADNDNNTKNIV